VTGGAYTALTTLHGVLAGLSLAVGAHPLVAIRTRGVSKYTVLTATLTAIGFSSTFALGWFVYPEYRRMVKPALYLASSGAVQRFETKEHLAALAVGLTVAGAATLRVAGRTAPGREAAFSLLATGWMLGLAVGLLGVYVRAAAHPGF
jgi:hypothetical protein